MEKSIFLCIQLIILIVMKNKQKNTEKKDEHLEQKSNN